MTVYHLQASYKFTYNIGISNEKLPILFLCGSLSI